MTVMCIFGELIKVIACLLHNTLLLFIHLHGILMEHCLLRPVRISLFVVGMSICVRFFGRQRVIKAINNPSSAFVVRQTISFPLVSTFHNEKLV